MNVETLDITEMSARKLAQVLRCHPRKIAEAVDAGLVPGAYRTDGGQLRIPLWGWKAFQAERGVRQ